MSFSDLIPLFFIGVAFLGAVIQILREPRAVSHSRMAEIFLNWAFVVIIGLGGIWAFIGHTVFADRVADSIGWPLGNPFQQEVAFSNLAIGVLGILSVKIAGTFRIAALISYAIFMVGAGIGHIWLILTVHDLAINNAGPVLWLDICMPLILIALYLFSLNLKKHETQPSLSRY
ncbi:MAG: DUF6790 family protein [Methanobacteriota archaeon]